MSSSVAVTVIVGFAEALAGPEVVWSLADQGFRVIAFARKGRRSALRHSRYAECHDICAPEIDYRRTIADLNTLMATARAEDGQPTHRVLLPLDDKAIWIARNLDLRQGPTLAGPYDANADLALSKFEQIQAAQKAGFNVPETIYAQTGNDVLEFARSQSFPIILKAAECVSIEDGRICSCPHWVCANEAELLRAISQWSERVPLLVQTYIEGIGEGVFGLATEDGVRAWSGHRRLRMMNPQGSGSSACISQSISDPVRDAAEQLIDNTGWRGIFMLELLRDSTGKVWFVELNGRSWGSMALSRNQGLEYPAWQVRLALDRHSDVGKTTSGGEGLVCRHAGRELMHLLFVLRGPKSKALTTWPTFGKAISDVMRIRSNDRFYNWRRDDLKVFFSDCYYTLRNNIRKE